MGTSFDGVDCSRHGATVATCSLWLFWMVVASLGYWLPDGGRGGVILEGAAVGDFPVQLVASSSSRGQYLFCALDPPYGLEGPF